MSALKTPGVAVFASAAGATSVLAARLVWLWPVPWSLPLKNTSQAGTVVKMFLYVWNRSHMSIKNILTCTTCPHSISSLEVRADREERTVRQERAPAVVGQRQEEIRGRFGRQVCDVEATTFCRAASADPSLMSKPLLLATASTDFDVHAWTLESSIQVDGREDHRGGYARRQSQARRPAAEWGGGGMTEHALRRVAIA
jgi:hypothetical protein